MKEEAVFWLGGKPGNRQAEAAPAVPAGLEAIVVAACRAHGITTEDFVAALGGYGSWLVHFRRDGQRQRIVWNGREAKLVLQEALRTGGWQDLRDCPLGDPDHAGFAAAIGRLVADPPRAG